MVGVSGGINGLHIAIPQVDSGGHVEGWYVFNDAYLSPSVQFTSEPPRTLLTLGARKLEIDRAVPLKIRLLEAEEDYKFWCRKKQHSQRVSCGEYHYDFSDVEVGYSFSSPQTHIWFAGYAIHAECLENLCFTSYNSTICVTPEHVMRGDDPLAAGGFRKPCPGQKLNDLQLTQSLFELVVNEGADFPIYTTAVPVRVHTHGGCITEMVPTVEFVNDCERDIRRVDAFDIGVGVSDKSSPTSYPPTYPAPRPFEHASLFWSYVHNKILRMRLVRDEMEQAAKDIALLIRAQNAQNRTEREDQRYKQAMIRLSKILSSERVLHQIAFPHGTPDALECACELCLASPVSGGGRRRAIKDSRRRLPIAADDDNRHNSHHQHHHHHRKKAQSPPSSVMESTDRCSSRLSSRRGVYNQYDTSDHKCAVCRTKEPEKLWCERAGQAEAGNALIHLCVQKKPERA